MDFSDFSFLTYSFYIPAEKSGFSFSLPMNVLEGEVSVVSSVLRPDVLCSLILGVTRTDEGFWEDLMQMTKYICEQNRPVDCRMLSNALDSMCRVHISTYGRLTRWDLLLYMDVFILVDSAIYEDTKEKLHNRYRSELRRVKNEFGQYITD